MKAFRPFIALCTSVLLLACEPQPIPITLADPPLKLVVSSQIIPDRIMVVALTRTFSTLEGASQLDSLSDEFIDKILVQDALVTVGYGNKTDTLRMVSRGIYASANTLQSDYVSYTLYARDPQTGETVTATSAMQPEVRFVRVEPDVVYVDGDVEVDVSYSFRDDPAVKNWYLVNFYKKINLSRDRLDINNYFGRGSNEELEFDLISDENLKDPDYSALRKLKGVEASDSIAVSISNVSQGYYDFLTLYKRAGNVITRISGEPIEYPTNVVNGYGYFTTHKPDIRFFDLNNYD
jgi:hypothetical protein